MALIQRVRFSEVQWLPILLALLMTGFGLAFVISATMDPGEPGWGREGQMQLLWWGVASVACLVTMHVPMTTWRALAPALFMGCLVVQALMFVLAGTSLVPNIKGAHNWIALGSLRLQPSEFFKLASLLLTARILTEPQVDIRRFSWCVLVGGIGLLPAVLIASEDLGSAITFVPMVLGMMIVAGMPLRYLGLSVVTVAITAMVGVASLPEDSYHIKRLRAWIDPESYALTEGFQTIRALRSIGSGQWTGKGYGVGDQNLLGWLPEKHTDMIFAVIGEELGFLGAMLVPALFCLFGFAGLFAAAQCRLPYGRLVVVGFTCLILGQATVNLFVVMGLMPVTGITLPFFSYGGSSLLGTYCGLGLCAAASVARNKQLRSTVYH
ncbi:MAG: FtsW/RodA/SpoVE family cell cycle protein [Planctomycetota bacterium]|nr:FtsW/RodA/SpoVE family cell cycle protein [Planctomycetota bacterium]